jgi:hypothetical protein
MRKGVEVSGLKESGHDLNRLANQAFSCRYRKTVQYGRPFGSDSNQATLEYKYTLVMVMQSYYYSKVTRILERVRNHPLWGTATFKTVAKLFQKNPGVRLQLIEITIRLVKVVRFTGKVSNRMSKR